VSGDGAEQYFPAGASGDGQPPDDYVDYADEFVPLAEAIDACPRGAQVVLLLSTCRNQWMTVNGAFVDIKEAIGEAANSDPLSSVLQALRNDDFTALTKPLHVAGASLSEIDRKLQVWSDRDSLLEEFETALEELDPRDADRVRRLVKNQRVAVPSDGQNADGRFLAISTQETEDGRRLFDEIGRIREQLGAVVRAATGLQRAYAPETAQASFDDVEMDDDPQWIELLTAVRGVVPGGEHSRTVAEILVLDDPLPEQRPAAPASNDIRLTLIAAAERVLAEVQDAIEKEFRPNVSRPPMPAPYVIDLTPVDNPAARRRPSYAIEVHRGNVAPAPNETRVALMRCGVPAASYSDGTRFRYLRGPGHTDASRIATVVIRGLEKAAEHGCKLVAMPECFLPEDSLAQALARAEELTIGLVAGVEYEAERVVNRAVIQLPAMQAAMQSKQRPSQYEPQSGFESDGILRTFYDTSVGTMAAVICSDYLELDLLSALASQDVRLDTLIVCTRNPHPDVFTRLAAADAARLHGHVLIVNSWGGDEGAHSDGTVAVQPARDADSVFLDPVENVAVGSSLWEGVEAPTLDIYELPVASVASGRDRARTVPGLLSAPAFVQLN
jgi:predicted amidohydrolase